MAKQTLDNHAHGGAEPTAAEVRAALERILRSRCFEHAGRASDFLRFVVGKTLAGEGNRLKGYTIAIHVFGRPADFDAKSDPLVRVEALRLRQRLTEYYAGEGSGDRVTAPAAARPLRGEGQLCKPRAGSAPAMRPAPPRRSCRGSAAGRARAAPLVPRPLLLVVAARRDRGATASARRRARCASVSAPERAHRTKITVVPLENLGTTSRLDRLAAGLTEEIMLRLDELDLFVIATQAGGIAPGKALDGVLGTEHSYVLTGSVRDQRGGARITLRIIEAETGAQIWAAAYDEPPGIEEQPELQAKVARDAAAAAGTVRPGVRRRACARAPRRAHARAAGLPNALPRFPPRDGPGAVSRSVRVFQSLVARQPRTSRMRGPAWPCCTSMSTSSTRAPATAAPRSTRARGRGAHGVGVGRHERLGQRGADALPVLRRRSRSSCAARRKPLAIDPNNPECSACSASC